MDIKKTEEEKIGVFSSWKRKIFLVWILIALGLWLFSGSPVDFFSAIGVIIAGFSTYLFWKFRKQILTIIKKWKAKPKWKFIIIGSLCAMWIEFEFWIIEMLTGATGIAADPNLFLDLLGTMPWYITMVWLLYKVESKYSYSLYGILILGGIYDLSADGILGLILGGGSLTILPLLLVIFPIFFLAYSFIVLPPSYLLREEINEKRIADRERNKKYRYPYALLPLIGLIVYSIVLILLMSIG